MAAARRRDLGGPGPPAPLHPLQGDGLGRLRPRRKLCEIAGRTDRPIEKWRKLARSRSTAEVCEKGFNAEKNSFVQYYGGGPARREPADAARWWASCPPTDPRIVGTVDAIQRELMRRRLRPALSDRRRRRGGRPAGGRGHVPAMTTFWLADNLALMGRCDEAQALFERPARAAQRRRAARRGVRPGHGAACSATSRRPSHTSGSSCRPPTCRRIIPHRSTRVRARRHRRDRPL